MTKGATDAKKAKAKIKRNIFSLMKFFPFLLKIFIEKGKESNKKD